MNTARVVGSLLGAVLAAVLFVPRAGAQNLLSDGGFELSTPNGTFPNSGYWKPAWLGAGGAVCTTTAAATGSSGLWEYTGSAASEWWSGQYQDLAAAPGEVFAASAAVRSQSSWVAGSKALVRISFLDASNSELVSKNSAAITSGSSAWQQLGVESDAAPAGTVHARVRLYLEKPSGASGQSIANFDDCSVEKVAVVKPILSVSPAALGYGSDLTSLSFEIRNSGNDTLSWSLGKDVDWASVSVASGTTTTEADTVTVTIDRSGLTSAAYDATITVTSDGGSESVALLVETASAAPVPSQPAIVTTQGRQLLLSRRRPDGSLEAARPYTIKGAAWAPASIGTLADVTSRRAEFANWYRLDIQLLREMNANTVYVFLDPGTTPALIDAAREVLDYCYRNGIMVVMTVDTDGSDDTANLASAVAAFKNHPAVLMWALGNEWNLWRPDRPLFYAHYDTLAAAASAMQANALQVKSIDTNHPVASILGEINYPNASAVSDIVNNICTAVDVWGANIYRGPQFYALFTEWQAMSGKPLFLSEFGTDAFHTTAWWPPVGAENDDEQAAYLDSLWQDIVPELSAGDPSKVCLGGTVFEFGDEWLKTPTGDPAVHDNGGYETTWNPIAHPDGFANEEWFGIVSIGRKRRQAYYVLQNHFAAGTCAAVGSDGLPCDDGLFCNGADTCASGACGAHAGNPCPGPDGDGNCAESCDEAVDACGGADPGGSACNDALWCNGADTCASGACSAHAGNPCPGPDGDGNCAESCDEAADACSGADPGGSACNDALWCNGADTCASGVCGAHAGNPCPGPDGDGNCAESCDEAADACSGADPGGSACNDGLWCDGVDACSHGACVGGATSPCNDSNACTDDACVEVSDACQHHDNFTCGTRRRDYSGDATADVVMRNVTTGAFRLFVFADDASTSNAGLLVPGAGNPDWKALAEGDFDGDGATDLLLRRSSTGDWRVALTNGFGPVGVRPLGLYRAANWQLAAVGDCNGDWTEDVVLRDSVSGAGRVFFVRDAAVFTHAFTALTAALNWKVAATGDFDGNGTNEILQRHAISGAMRIAYVLPGITPAVLTTLSVAADPAVSVACVADLDGDGVDDILTRRSTDNASFVVAMKLGQALSVDEVTLDGAQVVQKCEDYDGDGVDDVLLRDPGSGLSSVFRFVGGTPVSITPARLYKSSLWNLVP